MMPTYTRVGETDVVNIYGHSILQVVREGEHRGWRLSDRSRQEVANGR
jgi:hypothetical protein